MSFDLYFTKGNLSKDQLVEYFSNQSSFTIDNNQALYENTATGVYFIIDFNENITEENNYCASLNLNYYRPLFFGNEAAIVIEEFINKFDLGIFDPQNNGMGEGPFSKAGFINSWQSGNDFGYQCVLENPDSNGDVYCRPNEELYKIWEWNYKRETNCKEMNKDIFIPKISFALIDDKLCKFIVWPDAISALIPEVDYVLIMRQELAPKKWFKKREDKFFIPYKSLKDILNDYQSHYKGFATYDLPVPNTPDKIIKYVKELTSINNTVKLVPADSVLSLELIEKYNIRNNIIN